MHMEGPCSDLGCCRDILLTQHASLVPSRFQHYSWLQHYSRCSFFWSPSLHAGVLMPGQARAEKRPEKGEHTKRSKKYNSPSEANQQYRVWMCKTNCKWQAQRKHAKKRQQKIKRPWESNGLRKATGR